MFDAKNFKNLTPSEKEEKILNFWQQNKTFEKFDLANLGRAVSIYCFAAACAFLPIGTMRSLRPLPMQRT